MSAATNGTLDQPRPDYGTPPHVVAMARELLGEIDLDPACAAGAPADRILARVTHGPGNAVADGLGVPWYGRVFLNPPGGIRGGAIPRWWPKLVGEYQAGRVQAALFVAFSIDALQTSQRHTPGGLLAWPCYVPAARIAYLHHDSGALDPNPPKPSVLVYLPPPGVGHGQARHMLAACCRAHGLPGTATGGLVV